MNVAVLLGSCFTSFQCLNAQCVEAENSFSKHKCTNEFMTFDLKVVSQAVTTEAESAIVISASPSL